MLYSLCDADTLHLCATAHQRGFDGTIVPRRDLTTSVPDKMSAVCHPKPYTGTCTVAYLI